MKTKDSNTLSESCIPCFKWYERAWFSNTLLIIDVITVLIWYQFLSEPYSFSTVFNVILWTINSAWYYVLVRIYRSNKDLKMFKDERREDAII